MHLELYTDEKNPELEARIETVLTKHELFWNKTEVPYYTCYATVSSEAGKEDTDAGMIVDDTKVDFTIRWCKKASALDSTHYRVEFNGALYDITAIDHMNYKRKCIKLSCQKVRR